VPITIISTNIIIPNGRGVLPLSTGEEPSLADGLLRLSVLAQSAFTREAERHGLPGAQPRRMSELAGVLGIEKAALTGLADRAERRGLLARTAVPGDRRAVSVALTPEGLAAATAFHRDVVAALSRLAEALPPGERERFGRSLARVTAAAPWP
jgi:DNA-binding MarR family transcriptional regulator